MRSVLRDRDHVVLHRARSLPHQGPTKRISDPPNDTNRQMRDIRVHFSPLEPFSSTPTPPPANASTVRGGLGTTELFRLIEVQKYSLAIQRLYQFPKEASMWVSVASSTDGDASHHPLDPNDDPSKGPPGGVGRGSPNAAAPMMLPVHLACDHLAMHPKSDASSDKRRKVEALMAHLVSVFPASALRRNPVGQLPLHAALRNLASVETITALLCAAPESLVHVDTSTFPHLTPAQINHQQFEGTCVVAASSASSHANADTAAAAQEEMHRLDVVRQMLGRGVDFWDMAKREATLRIKHRTIPKEDASIGSLSVLATSFNHDDSSTLATTSLSQPHPRQLHHFQSHPSRDHPPHPPAREFRPFGPSLFPRRGGMVSFRKRRPSKGASRQAGIPEGRSADDEDDNDNDNNDDNENTVNQLLDRIQALESDKERLRGEVQELQSELARQEALRNELGRPQQPPPPPPPPSGADAFETSTGRRTPPPPPPLPPRRAPSVGDATAAGPAAEDRPVAVHKLRLEKENLERKVDALTKSNHVYQNLLQTFTSLHAHPGARTLLAPAEASNGEVGTNHDSSHDGRTSPKALDSPGPAPPPPATVEPRETSAAPGPSSSLASVTTTTSILDGFEVDSVILRAEQLAGHRLSQELVDAWRTVATSSDSVSELGSSSDGQRDALSPLDDDDDDDLEDDDNLYDDVTGLFSASSRSTASAGPRSVV